jgi:hypothetical protein
MGKTSLYPALESFYSPAGPLRANPAFIRTALANATGEFRIETIAPGEYTAIAFPPEVQPAPMFLDNIQWVEGYERYGQHLQIAAHVESRMDLVATTP